jgi:hypothetical protein
MQNKNLIIYKFRDFKIDHHKSVLYDNLIYFPSISELNDPFDSKITFNFKELDAVERKNFLDKIKKKMLEKQQKDHYNAFESFFNFNNQITFQYLNNLEIDAAQKRIGIFSTSLIWNNILMWSHYANNHSGFAIGFKEEILRKSQKFHFGSKVEYPKSQKFPLLKPSMNDLDIFYKRFYVKSYDWKYEQEFRLINEFKKEDEKRTLNYPLEAIEEVIIGFNMEELSRQEIIKFCKKNNIKVYITEAIPFRFKLKRIKI